MYLLLLLLIIIIIIIIIIIYTYIYKVVSCPVVRHVLYQNNHFKGMWYTHVNTIFRHNHI